MRSDWQGAGSARAGVCRPAALAGLLLLLLLSSCVLVPERDPRPDESRAAVPVRVQPSAAEIHAQDVRGGAQVTGSVADESLLNTYWKLIELRGQPVAVGEQQREPHLILHREGNRVSAHGGCNRLAGRYSLAGDRLTFGKLAGTKMACEGGFQDEVIFAAALAASTAWQIQGQFLILFDQGGARMARFEVRHL